MTQSSSPGSRRSCLTKGTKIVSEIVNAKLTHWGKRQNIFLILGIFILTEPLDLQFLYVYVYVSVRILVPSFTRVKCTFSFFLIHARTDLFKEWDIPKLQMNFRYFTYAIYMKIFAFWCSNLNKFVFRELVCRDGNGKCIFDFPP